MDIVASSFIILMLLVGGGSAYIADLLGYKIGKKRLSVWHIRPKYVARISVTVAGVLLPLVTIALVALASKDVRVWLTKGRAAIVELQSTTQELEKVQSELVAQQKAKSRLENDNKVINSELFSKRKEFKEQETKLKNLGQTLTNQRSQLSSLSGQVEKSRATISKLNFDSSKSRALFEKTSKFFNSAQIKLKIEQDRLAKTTIEREKASADFVGAQKDYKRALELSSKLGNRNLELDKQNSDLLRDLNNLQTNIKELDSQLSLLKNEKASNIAQAKEELAKLDSEITQLKATINEVRNEAAQDTYALRIARMNFFAGEELTRTLLPSGTSPAECSNIIDAAIRTSRFIAIARGSKPSKDAPFQGEAGIFNISQRKGDYRQEVIQAMSSARRTMLMVTRASMNRFEGEPLSLKFEFYENPVVFKTGDIIAEARVDGRRTQADIFAQIRDFLKISVNERLRRAKFVPIIARDGETFGELSAEQILGAMNLIQSTPRIVRIQAIARNELRTGDKLAFDLVIK